MTPIEHLVRKLAAEVGAPQGRHEVDGRDLVNLAAGWVTNWYAEKADKGDVLVKVHDDLRGDVQDGQESAGEPLFAAALAKLCAEIVAWNPEAPGDAIRDAFAWTGWCHNGYHGSGTQVRVRLQGPGIPDRACRTVLEESFVGVLLRELVTSEAVDEAYKAWKKGGDNYWARRWKAVRAVAMAEVFPNGLPRQTHLRMRFSYSPW